jgi:hypothetical protein
MGRKEQVRVPLLPSMPKGEIVGMFYRQSMLVIDGKYNNDDGLSIGRMCQAGHQKSFGKTLQSKLNKIRVCNDGSH